MRYEMRTRDGKLIGHTELLVSAAEAWRALQRLQVQLRPAPVAPVVTQTKQNKPKGKRSTDVAS